MKTTKQIQVIRRTMRYVHFNEDYEERMEKEQIEMNNLLSVISNDFRKIYDYVSVNTAATPQKWN